MIDVRTTTEKATTKDTDSTICDVNEMTLKKGGFECKGNCINNNVGYHNWSIAWEKCGEIESCTRIFRWENGSHYYYHLRKADDEFVNNPRFLYVDYNPKCRGTLFYNYRSNYM